MTKTVTTPYDVAEHLRTLEEMAAYLDACLEEADGMLHSLRRHWEISLVPRVCPRVAYDAGLSPRKSLQGTFRGTLSDV